MSQLHNRSTSWALLAPGLAVCASLAMAAPSIAQDTQAPAEMAIPQLKRAYLDCERAATTEGMETEDARQCSLIYEALKRRAFDNEFRQLRNWTRQALRDSA